MKRIRVQTTIKRGGVLHVAHLPCSEGERVEAVILVPDDRGGREAACRRFLARAKRSRFRSSGSYPTRSELHERH